MKRNKQHQESIQENITYSNDEERLEYLKSIKTLNPFKAYNIKSEIHLLENKIKAKKFKDKLLAVFTKNKKIVIAGLLVLIIIPVIVKLLTSVMSINFTTKEDAVYVGDKIDTNYNVFPSFANYDDDDISVELDKDDLTEYSGDDLVASKEGTISLTIKYNNKNYGKKIINILPIEIQTISINNISVGVNLEKEMEIDYFPKNATHKEIFYVVEDDKIAKISDNKVLGLKEGKTTVIAKSVDGPETTFNINVEYIEPEQLNINNAKEYYRIGDVDYLTTDLDVNKISNKEPVIDWISSNEKVIELENDGKLKAVGKGTAIVTAKYSDDIYASKEIEIKNPNADSIKIISNSDTIYLNNSKKLTIKFEPEIVDDDTIVWKSDNENIATIDEHGNVYAVGLGNVLISATTVNGKSDTVELNIEEYHHTSSNANNYNGSISRGDQGSSNNNSGGIWTSGTTVFITQTGKKYHYSQDCAGSKSWQVSLEEALKKGLGPCGKCVE